MTQPAPPPPIPPQERPPPSALRTAHAPRTARSPWNDRARHPPRQLPLPRRVGALHALCAALLPLALLPLGSSCTFLLGAEQDYHLHDPGDGGHAGAQGEGGQGGSVGTCGDTRSDPDNCGTCGHVCPCGQCLDGACAPLEIVRDPLGIADSPSGAILRDGRAYWISADGQHIRSALADPRTPADASIDDYLAPQPIRSLALADDGMYWLAATAIWFHPYTPSGSATRFHDVDMQGATDIATSGGYVYWVDPMVGTVDGIREDGTDLGTVSNDPNPLRIDAYRDETVEVVVWMTPYGIVRSSTVDNLVRKVADWDLPIHVRLDGQRHHVFWTADRAIVVHDLETEEEVTLEGIDLPAGFTFDDEYVYWSETRSGEIRRASRTTWKAERIHRVPTGTSSPSHLMVQDECLYWVDQPTGSIHAFSKAPSTEHAAMQTPSDR
ncbi:hypothetical protein [Chondromyces crocatus]|uniref:Uncharacterized protein n=1 Tax=Chondromyces crocatus TaxID=52 RepID=A0A0K1E9E9_CHOCO|nr:hypothetical protein [Chondromyces crocatus]AKT37302.1 uncharacterized protein CMC5_014340 [Chondromyces crocatus]